METEKYKHAVEVLTQCKSIYASLLEDYFYQPSPRDARLLQEFKSLSEIGVIYNQEILKKAGLATSQAIWLVGYTANQF